jgi:hypothetical protein
MTTPGDDLIAFLNARLDEDEAAAKAWLPFGNPDAAQREHVARRDPARVLRQVKGGRLILAEHGRQWDGGHRGCGRCDWDHYVLDDVPQACQTVRALGVAWSDHPDYRAEWAPDAL